MLVSIHKTATKTVLAVHSKSRVCICAKVDTVCCCGLQLGKGCLYAACLCTVRYAVVIYLFILAKGVPGWRRLTASMWTCLPVYLLTGCPRMSSVVMRAPVSVPVRP